MLCANVIVLLYCVALCLWSLMFANHLPFGIRMEVELNSSELNAAKSNTLLSGQHTDRCLGIVLILLSTLILIHLS